MKIAIPFSQPLTISEKLTIELVGSAESDDGRVERIALKLDLYGLCQQLLFRARDNPSARAQLLKGAVQLSIR